MTIKRINTVIGVAIVAIVGVITLQGFWLYSSYVKYQKNVRHRAHQAAVFTAKKIEQKFFEDDRNQLRSTADVSVFEWDSDSGNVQSRVAIYTKKNDSEKAQKIIIVNGDTVANDYLKRFKHRSKRNRRFKQKRLTKPASKQLEWIVNLDDHDVDSLLQREWAIEDVGYSYSFKIVTDPQVDLQKQIEKNSRRKVVVPIIREFSQDLPVYLEVDIEQSPYSFHRWFWIQIVLAIMFSSGMIWAFWFVAKGLIQQKRISDMKTDFINNVSHELKTPLATISLAADALKKSEVQQQEAQVDVYANIVKEEGKKMNRQVEQILNAALLEKQDLSLNKTTLDLNQVLGEVVESFSLQLQEKNGTINLTKNVSTVSCVGDEFHLKHVFTNLIDNAIKYSKESPEITVDIKMEPKHVVVSVSDKGIGMTIEEQGHLFEKFYRVSEGNLHSVKGFGLGLHYVKHVVEAHGGSVYVQSQKGVGTTFALNLPC